MPRKLVFTNHLLARIKLRRISREFPPKIYQEADSYYFDIETNLFVAVKSVVMGKNKKKFALAFEIKDDIVYLVTIHPIKKNQEENRIKTNRWQKVKIKT